MKVSYYELLGMIKDKKNPEKVILKDIVYTWNGENYLGSDDEYIAQDISEIEMIEKNIIIVSNPVEIIKEDKEIEEIPLKYTENKIQSEIYEYLRCVINEVIRKINKIEKEGK